MATCDTCGTTIVFGPVRDGDRKFCNKTCLARASALKAAAMISDADARAEALRVHGGACPLCRGPGPVDLHESMFVWSLILVTRWKTERQVSCRSCGRKKQALSLAGAGLLGWWGFPFGLAITPVAIVKNAYGMISGPRPDAPSPKLVQVIRSAMARRNAAPPPQVGVKAR